jgi:hypothetical protein
MVKVVKKMVQVVNKMVQVVKKMVKVVKKMVQEPPPKHRQLITNRHVAL